MGGSGGTGRGSGGDQEGTPGGGDGDGEGGAQIKGDHDGAGGAVDFTGGGIEDFLLEGEGFIADFCHSGVHFYFIAGENGQGEVAVDVDGHGYNAMDVKLFGEAGAEKVGFGQVEVLEVDGVVDVAEHVEIGPAGLNFYFMVFHRFIIINGAEGCGHRGASHTANEL